MNNLRYAVLGIGSCIIWFWPVSSFAATYYVGKMGHDAHTCIQARSRQTPTLTIQAAVHCATSAGDTVVVQAGTYVESVTSWHSGARGRPITVQAHPGDHVIWRGSGSDPASLTGAIEIHSRSYIRIAGLTFDGTATRATIRVLNATGNKTATPIQGIDIVNNTFANNGNTGKHHLQFSRTIYFQAVGRDHQYTGGTVNTIAGNTFDANYGCDIFLNGTSDTLLSGNVSTHLKSSKSSVNQNWFVARSIYVGAEGFGYNSRRNIVEKNVISHMLREPYVDTTHEAEGIRLDVNADHNTFRQNVIHHLDHGIPWSFATRSYGIYAESGCDDNVFSRNIIYNIGEACMRSGSRQTTVGVGNQWCHNVGCNCGKAGLVIGYSQNGVFTHNILYNRNASSQIYMSAASVRAGGNRFAYNDYYSPNTSHIAVWNAKPGAYTKARATYDLAQWRALSGDTHSLSVDPRFINPLADFRLQPQSPLIHAGAAGKALGAFAAPEPADGSTP